MTPKPYIVALAGCSGAGKTTLAWALQDHFGPQCCLLQLDDYFKPGAQVPMLGSFKNWDHPDALYLDAFAVDAQALANGKAVQVLTKNKRLNPNHDAHNNKIPVTVKPAEIVVLEGYLALHHPTVRGLADVSFYLDASPEIRNRRRDKLTSPEYAGYIRQVLEPMAAQYVYPTRDFATYVIQVDELSPDEVLARVLSRLTVKKRKVHASFV